MSPASKTLIQKQMRAQASVEFLFGFLALIALISILIAALSHFHAAAQTHVGILSAKASIEQYARTLDAAQCIRHERLFQHFPSEVQIEKTESGRALILDIHGYAVKGYTIYGIGEIDGEPV